jgi:hypothetical protein
MIDMVWRVIFAALLGSIACSVLAQPVKCVDAKGKVRYIDKSMMALEKCEPVRAETNIVPAGPTSKPAAKPVDDSAQRAANLAQAEKALADAKKSLADQEAIRQGDERNYARVEERLKPFQAAVESAEKNLEQARRNR